MLSFEVNALLSLVTGVGAIIGWIRIRKTDPAFLPFIFLLTTGFITELTSIFFIYAGYSNAFVYNLYTLAEALLITWQFRYWQLFRLKRTSYFVFKLLLVCGWLMETFLRQELTSFNSYYIIVTSVFIVFTAINGLNRVLFASATPLYRNPVFLICLGLVVYFTYSVLVEVFWLYGLNRSTFFRLRVYQLFVYVNLFSNLLFVTATLWIPLKQRYILPL